MRQVRVRKRCPDFVEILRHTPPTAAVREQVAECFYSEMSRVAGARCRDATLAEDVVQDAMTAGLAALGSFRGDAPLEAWLRRLVLNACSRVRRGRKNDPNINQPLDEALEEGLAAPQELHALVNERLRLVQLALESVAEPNRSMLVAHEAYDSSLVELAGEFGLTVEAVKARLKRTRRQLRERLVELAEELVPAPTNEGRPGGH